jgi:hypothetical protein
LGLHPTIRSNHELHGVKVPGDVIVYFGDIASKTYQLEQWLPVLEHLNKFHKVLLVFRKVAALREIRSSTSLPMIFVRRFEDLVTLYEENEYGVCLYVNNGASNFQSLSHSRMMHVHINHGESDKLSMVSNQAKAYDKVLVAGPAAVARHRAVLVDFDDSNLLMVGRPQLDLDFAPQLQPFTGQTIMYAPTWEGENAANNYTSVDVYGSQILDAVLALPATRVVYKPHPRVIDSTTPGIDEAHQCLMEKINRANEAGGQHIISESGNILAMFEHIDALVSDVSSVSLDFLYRHPDRPLMITDRRSNRSQLARDAPLADACLVIDKDSISRIDDLMKGLVPNDTFSEGREQMRRHYFGDLGPGESTAAFVETIGRLLADRQSKLKEYYFHGSPLESVDDRSV